MTSLAAGSFEYNGREFMFNLIDSIEDHLNLNGSVRGFLGIGNGQSPSSLIHSLSPSLPEHITQYYLLIYLNQQVVGVVSIQRVDFKINEFIKNTSVGILKKLGFNFASKIGGSVFNGHIWIMGHLLLTGFPYFSIEKEVLSPEDTPFELLIAAFSSLKSSLPNRKKIISLAIMQVYRNGGGEQSGLSNGWKSFPIDPVMRLKVDKKWSSFEDYFQALRSRYRKKARSVLNNSQHLEINELSSREVMENRDKIFFLFKDLLKNIPFNIIYPETDFFNQNLNNLRGYRIFGVFLKGEMVGFFSCLKLGKIMEGHFLGYDRKVNESFDVYKFMLFALVSRAITEDCEFLYLGRTASIAKLNIGADPLPSNMIMMPLKHAAKRLLGLYYKHLYQSELPPSRNTFK